MATAPNRRELFLDHGRVSIECPRLSSEKPTRMFVCQAQVKYHAHKLSEFTELNDSPGGSVIRPSFKMPKASARREDPSNRGSPAIPVGAANDGQIFVAEYKASPLHRDQ
jgi:hypothetical protein